jgi:hypothetical protein
MQTMEQSLAELTLRRVITPEAAFSRTSRPEQLLGLLESGGFPPFELEVVSRNGLRTATEVKV